MHQQPGDRSCSQEAIGGNHYGPVIVYLAKVSDAKTAAGSSASWFKVAELGLVSNNPNYWGVQVFNVSLVSATWKHDALTRGDRTTAVTLPSLSPTSRLVNIFSVRKSSVCPRRPFPCRLRSLCIDSSPSCGQLRWRCPILHLLLPTQRRRQRLR